MNINSNSQPVSPGIYDRLMQEKPSIFGYGLEKVNGKKTLVRISFGLKLKSFFSSSAKKKLDDLRSNLNQFLSLGASTKKITHREVVQHFPISSPVLDLKKLFNLSDEESHKLQKIIVPQLTAKDQALLIELAMGNKEKLVKLLELLNNTESSLKEAFGRLLSNAEQAFDTQSRSEYVAFTLKSLLENPANPEEKVFPFMGTRILIQLEKIVRKETIDKNDLEKNINAIIAISNKSRVYIEKALNILGNSTYAEKEIFVNKLKDSLITDATLTTEERNKHANVLGYKTLPDTFNELVKAYRKLARQYHPDVPGGNKEMFQEINNSLDSLKSCYSDGKLIP